MLIKVLKTIELKTVNRISEKDPDNILRSFFVKLVICFIKRGFSIHNFIHCVRRGNKFEIIG